MLSLQGMEGSYAVMPLDALGRTVCNAQLLHSYEPLLTFFS